MEQETLRQPSTDRYPSECTTIIVGGKHTADGSMIVARSEDWNAVLAKNLELYRDTAPSASSPSIVPSAVTYPRKPSDTQPLPPTTYTDTGEVQASIPLASV
mgnify:CR=1 FL=1